MPSARIGHAFETLRCTAKPAPMAAVVVNPPPGDPRAEREIVTVRRRVIRRCRGNCPIRFGVCEPAAGIIFRFDRKICLAAYKMRSLGLDLCHDFELRTTKLLDLKLVRKTFAGNTALR